MVMKNSVVWGIVPCGLLKVNRHFGVIYLLHLQGRQISQVRTQYAADTKHVSWLSTYYTVFYSTKTEFSSHVNGLKSLTAFMEAFLRNLLSLRCKKTLAYFVGSVDLSARSQVSVVRPYPEPLESSPHSHVLCNYVSFEY